MIFRERTGVICVHKGELLVCRFCDPTSKKVMLVVPGGGLEEGESTEDCATREVLEETGYKVRITADAGWTDYIFDWNAKLYHCKTHWFHAVLDPADQVPAKVDDEAYNWGPGWLPVEEIRSAFAYNASICETILRLTQSV